MPVTVSGNGTPGSPYTLTGTLAGVYTVTEPLVGVIITGNAKWGATVTVSGGSSSATATADPYSGRFEVSVCLTPNGTNMLSITAMDGTGTSQATVVSVPAPGTTSPQQLTVVPAAPMPPKLEIQTPATPPPGTQVVMATANQALVYAYTLTDMYGNQIPNDNVTVTTNMPAATIGAVDTQYTDSTGNVWYQGDLLNFVRSGTWAVNAHIAGTTQTASQKIVINPDPTTLAAMLTLTPNNITQVGAPITYQVKVIDAFGNVDTSAVASNFSFALSPTPPVAATCNSASCTTAPVATSGTITFPVGDAGIYEITAQFSGTPAVLSASQFVSVINAPIPPTLTITSPTASLVSGTLNSIPIQLQIHFNSPGGGTVEGFATGAVNASFPPQAVGQTVCGSGPPCPTQFSFNPAGFNQAQPASETITVIATDGTTGASITESVTFTVDLAQNIQAPGHTVTIVARAGASGAAPMISSPEGLTTFGAAATGTLYVANFTPGNVLSIPLGGPFPVVASNVSTFATAGAVTDAQLQPLSTALGTYPPAAFEGLFLGGAGAMTNLRLASNTGVVTSMGGTPITSIISTAYQAAPPMMGSPRLFASDNTNQRVQVVDPNPMNATYGTSQVALNLGAMVHAGVTYYVNAATTTTRVVVADAAASSVRICDIGNTNTPATWGTSCTANEGYVAQAGMGATLQEPRAVAIGPATGRIYVTSHANGRVNQYNQASASCPALAALGTATAGSCPETSIATGFQAPFGITFDSAGNLYVSDTVLNLIVQIAPNGAPF
jgi:hypothetical protein